MKKFAVLLFLPLLGLVLMAQVPQVPFRFASVSFSGSGDNSIVAAPATGGTCIYGLTIVNSDAATATNITIKDGASNTLTGAFRLVSGGSAFWALKDNAKNPYWVTSLGNAFIINSSAAVQISGDIHYASPCTV